MRRELWIDLDGTLLGSHSGRLKRHFLKRSLSYLRTRLGLNFFQALLVIHRMRKAIETPGSELRNEERAAKVLANALSVSQAEALTHVHEMAVYAFAGLQDCFFPIDGAMDFVEWARSRYDLVLATNPVWPESVVKLRLSWSGIRAENFSQITHVSSMRACKPHVDYYRELEARRKPDGHNGTILMIGDSLKKDRPVIALGIPFFWLRPKRELKYEADLIWSGGFGALKLFLEKEWK